MTTETLLSTDDLSVSPTATTKFLELFDQVEEDVEGIRIYATPGGCSGVSFGMTFTNEIADNDAVLPCDGFKVIVDDATMEHMRGVEVDFADNGSGQQSFTFNNLPEAGGGCGTCGSATSGGGCG